MAIDNKYGRVTLERGTIGEDEPVMVFRGRDTLLPRLIYIYEILCEVAGSPQHHLDLINDSALMIERWQRNKDNPVQVPNSNWFMRWQEQQLQGAVDLPDEDDTDKEEESTTDTPPSTAPSTAPVSSTS